MSTTIETSWTSLADKSPPELIPVLCLTESHGTMTGTRIGNTIHCGVPWHDVVVTHWKIASWDQAIDDQIHKLDSLLKAAEELARQTLPNTLTASRLALERERLRYMRDSVAFVTRDMDELLDKAEKETPHG